MKDQETTAAQALEEEARRHREACSKLEREKSTELELLHSRWARGHSHGVPGQPASYPHGSTSPRRDGNEGPSESSWTLQLEEALEASS